jgi:hypothetical protein
MPTERRKQNKRLQKRATGHKKNSDFLTISEFFYAQDKIRMQQFDNTINNTFS